MIVELFRFELRSDSRGLMMRCVMLIVIVGWAAIVPRLGSLFIVEPMIFLLIGYAFAGNYGFGKDSEVLGYLLSKPCSRKDILASRLLAVCVLFATFVLVLSVTEKLIGSRSQVYTVNGYENVLRMEQLTQFKKSYYDHDDQVSQESTRSSIDTFLAQGKSAEAEKAGRYYSELFILAGEFDRRIILNYMLMIVGTLSAIIWNRNVKQKASRQESWSLTDNRWMLLQLAPLFLIFGALIGLGKWESEAYLLSLYLGYFEVVCAVFLLWVAILILLLRKNYSEISL
jgi:hypothetical protein